MITVSVSVCLSVSVSVNIYTFHTAGRNSNWIFTKLGRMVGYRLEMMPIVGFYGPVITAVLVH